MKYSGEVKKLKGVLASPIEYYLPIGNTDIPLNSYLGKEISLKYLNEIRCQACQQVTSKSYSQGYCFPCSQSLARCDLCIVRPERCHFSLGTCREPEWGEAHCMVPHIVYLANTSGIKVGITRETQIPTRWIDQGAVAAIPMFKVATRHLSGLIEVILAKHIQDKTDWRKMLKGEPPEQNLISVKKSLWQTCETDILKAVKKNTRDLDKFEYLGNHKDNILSLQYPVLQYPSKVTALNLEKLSSIRGTLQGIKGQYLILSTGVLNIRNLTGVLVEISVETLKTNIHVKKKDIKVIS